MVADLSGWAALIGRLSVPSTIVIWKTLRIQLSPVQHCTGDWDWVMFQVSRWHGSPTMTASRHGGPVVMVARAPGLAWHGQCRCHCQFSWYYDSISYNPTVTWGCSVTVALGHSYTISKWPLIIPKYSFSSLIIPIIPSYSFRLKLLGNNQRL